MGWQDPLRCSGYVDALGGIERLIPAVLIRCPSLRSLCAHLSIRVLQLVPSLVFSLCVFYITSITFYRAQAVFQIH